MDELLAKIKKPQALHIDRMLKATFTTGWTMPRGPKSRLSAHLKELCEIAGPDSEWCDLEHDCRRIIAMFEIAPIGKTF